MMNKIRLLILQTIYRISYFLSKDTLSIDYLTPLYKSYLPWSAASMQPSSIVTILNDIIINDRKFIVECGSGISTYFIAQLLKTNGGQLVTIDHDSDWLSSLEQILDKAQLCEFVKMIYAPLTSTDLSINNCAWYDTTQLDQAFRSSNKIDLLIVDGPPASGQQNKFSRYPAVPYFHKYLSARYSIFLHDINRKPERQIVSMWEFEYGMKFVYRYLEGKLAVSQSENPYAI